jgi:hypothetical protein
MIGRFKGQNRSYLDKLLLEKVYEVHVILRWASTFNTSRFEWIYPFPHSLEHNLDGVWAVNRMVSASALGVSDSGFVTDDRTPPFSGLLQRSRGTSSSSPTFRSADSSFCSGTKRAGGFAQNDSTLGPLLRRCRRVRRWSSRVRKRRFWNGAWISLFKDLVFQDPHKQIEWFDRLQRDGWAF